LRENAFARVRGRSARSLPALPARNRPEMSSEDVIDERGEHDDVVHVVTRREVEDASAGDQPERRVVRVAVDELGREAILRVSTNPRHLEHRDRTVAARDHHPVAGSEMPKVEEDRRTSCSRVDVSEDDGRPERSGSGREPVPAGLVVRRSRRYLDRPVGVQAERQERRVDADRRDVEDKGLRPWQHPNDRRGRADTRAR